MNRALLVAGVAALIALPAAAAAPTEGDRLGTEMEEVASALAAAGLHMTQFEYDDDELEVTAIGPDRRYELEIAPDSGIVTEVESRSRGGRWPLPGIDDAELRERLRSEGYTIDEYERERGEIEVTARKDGKHWEIEVDPRTGEVLKVEEEH